MLQDHKRSDKAAKSLFRVHGFWGELYVGKERRITDLDLARKLLNAQLRMLISEVKWPRAPPEAGPIDRRRSGAPRHHAEGETNCRKIEAK